MVYLGLMIYDFAVKGAFEGRFLIAHFSSRDEINSFHAGLPEPICHHVLPNEGTIKEFLSSAPETSRSDIVNLILKSHMEVMGA